MTQVVELIPVEVWIAMLLSSIALLMFSALKPKAIAVHALGMLVSFVTMLTASLVGSVAPDGTVVYIASTALIWAIPGFILIVQVLLFLVSIMAYVSGGSLD